MTAQRFEPGSPSWREWAERSFPNGWLAVGGPYGGTMLKAGQTAVVLMAAAEVPRARFWEAYAPRALVRPESIAFVEHRYRHERLSFPPALWWHVYVHESLTMDEAQTALFYRLLRDEPGVEDVRRESFHG